MNREHDELTHVIEAWLETTEASEDPAAVFDHVIGRLDAMPQRRSWWTAWRSPAMSNPVRLVVAAAVVVAVAVLAGNLIAGPHQSNLGGPGTAESPTPVATPGRTTGPSLAPTPSFGPNPSTEPLAPGLHVITDVVPFQVSVDMPGGWIRYPRNPTGWFAFKFGGSNTDGCCWIGFTTADPGSCVAFGDVAEINIDGFAGNRIEIPTTGCHPNMVLDSLGVPGGRGLHNLLTLYVLDVGGEEMVLFAWTNPPDVAQQEVAEQLIESVQIERR